MTIRLGFDHYGKSDVHVSKITRHDGRNDFAELTVHTRLEGDFETAHTLGDNHHVVPTDTQRNTVYALAAQQPLDPIEGFATALASHFAAKDAISAASVSVIERRWHRIPTAGDGLHPTAFVRGSSEVRTCQVRLTAAGERTVHAGLRDLVVLKTANSAFAGYPRDAYTTLPETWDRIFSTSLTAEWTYPTPAVTTFSDTFASVRQILLEVFADHDSLSVQHTLYAMGRAVLERIETVGEIRLTMPNIHHLPVDLTRFGLENRNEIFEPTTAPAGFIEALVVRG